MSLAYTAERCRPSSAKNIQNLMYVLSILKVMSVCISKCTSICDFFAAIEINISQAVFVINTAYLLRGSSLCPPSGEESISVFSRIIILSEASACVRTIRSFGQH